MPSDKVDLSRIIEFVEALKSFVKLRGFSRRDVSLLVSSGRDTFRFIRSLPVIEVKVSNTRSGLNVKKHLDFRPVVGLANRWALSALVLPEEPADFLKGRRKQAFRTNITRAKALGLRTACISGVEFRRLCQAVELKAAEKLLREPLESGMEHWVALRANGDVLAFARLQVDRQVTVLKYLGAVDTDVSSEARYLLSADIFVDLARRGVSYVLIGSIFTLDKGLAYFHDRVGFVPRRVKLSLAPCKPLEACYESDDAKSSSHVADEGGTDRGHASFIALRSAGDELV